MFIKYYMPFTISVNYCRHSPKQAWRSTSGTGYSAMWTQEMEFWFTLSTQKYSKYTRAFFSHLLESNKIHIPLKGLRYYKNPVKMSNNFPSGRKLKASIESCPITCSVQSAICAYSIHLFTHIKGPCILFCVLLIF